jgi:sirohydrochlorin ferrochelatase
MTTSLILIAHGSRNPRSNDEVFSICDRLSSNTSVTSVTPAFLELAEPSLLDTVRQVVESGATHILVLPYFLNSGRHVTQDVPALLEEARTDQPEVRIDLLTHIGGTQAFLAALEVLVSEQLAKATKPA